jgi:hypothetical protein
MQPQGIDHLTGVISYQNVRAFFDYRVGEPFGEERS